VQVDLASVSLDLADVDVANLCMLFYILPHWQLLSYSVISFRFVPALPIFTERVAAS
jgi:hypothetical protein